MGSRSAWLAVAGPLFCAAACSGQVESEEGSTSVAGGGAAGKAGATGSGAGGKASGFAGGPSSPNGGIGAAPPSTGGALDFPGGAAGWIGGYAGGFDDPGAGTGGVYYPPNPCAEFGSCAGSPGDAGAGGAEDSAPGECDSGKGCLVAQGSSIRALAADTTDLYWVDHGTFDDLGNYQNDGRLLKRGLVSGSDVLALASGLPGPVGVGLTTTHVFVYLDQVWQGKPRYALARVPIAGGAAQVVQLDAWPNGERGGDCFGCLVHAGDTLYFPLQAGIYKIAAQDTAPSLFSSLRASSLAIAGEYLYLVAQTGTAIWRVPLAGGDAELLSADPRLNIQVAADYLYSLDNTGNNAYLTRMPAAGGPGSACRRRAAPTPMSCRSQAAGSSTSCRTRSANSWPVRSPTRRPRAFRSR
ncbi:MAG: hypothetical protein WDO74_04205 [Pseudomonadota bacterium]